MTYNFRDSSDPLRSKPKFERQEWTKLKREQASLADEVQSLEELEEKISSSDHMGGNHSSYCYFDTRNCKGKTLIIREKSLAPIAAIVSHFEEQFPNFNKKLTSIIQNLMPQQFHEDSSNRDGYEFLAIHYTKYNRYSEQGTDAPEGVHPNNLKGNKTQRVPRSSKEMQDNLEESEAIMEVLEDLLKFVSQQVMLKPSFQRIFMKSTCMVATATHTILENLDRIPDEGDRTKVAIVCYDTSLYFFSLPSPIGGKIMALSSSLPSVSAGALKNREDAKVLGTAKESGLLQAASPFYKTFAIKCLRAHVSVDMFLFSSAYIDVTTLACLPHYTSGQTYYYPAFNAGRSEDALKFAHELGEVLAMPIMLEAVMRVRALRGLRMASFHGSFFVRSTDLLAMPSVPQDQSYAIEVQIEETITAPFVVFQTAVLHTTCFDQVAIGTLFANKAIECALTHKLEDSKDYVFQKLVEILGSYKTNMTAGGAGASAQLAISENMKMLPMLILSLSKNVGIRQSAQIPPDIRATYICVSSYNTISAFCLFSSFMQAC
ncbi:hypothetical protein H0H92_011939 [Tricholoma furcatifolium]|nr:hypothetical protein H0H92_011939 [Tricholoma furcatifolium]